MTIDATRRSFLVGSAAGAGVLAAACAGSNAKPKTGGDEHGEAGEKEEEVTPAEDLMREHGALNRILLVYEEAARRLDAATPLPIDRLANAAQLVRSFIEGYHEKLEEDFLFPRFVKANKLVDLVGVLRAQHVAGRALTESILASSTVAAAQLEDQRKKLAGALRSFARMYRPHEAREDTVLFPALSSIIDHNELHELGEQFEEKEHALFGKEGFEGVVAQIAAIEQAFGIYDLAQFTPTTG
jgi:hemerythrin-like domain-containing protein